MRCIYYFLFLVAFIQGCCYSDRENIIFSNKETYVNVQDIIDTSSIKYVFLEATPACLIGRIAQLRITDSSIYVLNAMPNVLYRFDNNGKFICQIGKQGRGPGEYLTIGNIDVNEKQEVILFDSELCRVLVFDKQGKFLRAFENEYYPYGEILCLNDTLYALENYFYNSNIPFNPEILILNDTGKIVRTFLPRKDMIGKKSILSTSGNTCYFARNIHHIFYIPLGSDVLYRLSSNGLYNDTVCCLQLADGMLAMDIKEKDYKTEKKIKYGPIQSLGVTDEGILYGSINFDDRPISLIGNIKEGIKIAGRLCSNEEDWPGLIFPLTTYRDFFVGKKNYLALPSTMRNANTEDINPIIVFFKFKLL